ncbi:hypothetical protein EPR50_G00243850 [Perca flavescens]|uniref:RING-type domain-containing protein n=1 Tax=Perca flavescens TaxID=8167 RepID=A0A484C1Y5_PERFV|nr:putative RING-H2 finger protein ATL71 [Perca flavescens]TDG95912.1 hypothetical protein EPR50_G00243850 [Perca flavescens]
MDPDKEEAEELVSDSEDPFPERVEEEEEEEGEKEEEDDEEEKDALIFSAWMQRYRGGEQRDEIGEEEEKEEEEEGGRPESRCCLEPPVRMRTDRRASLPCPATLSAMHLSRLHSSTRPAVTAKVLLKRSSLRNLLPVPQEVAAATTVATVTATATTRRPSLTPGIHDVMAPEKRGQFRRRNVMSLSDAYSVCLICHNDLSRGSGTRELQCTHTYHKECIEEWLWRKQSCPTCHVQVSIPQPAYWSSTRAKVP